jgi:ElaA protein
MELHIKNYEELTVDELYDLLRARSEVFVVEQDCVYQDLDNKDKKAYHVWLSDEDGIAAYLRVLPSGVSYDEPSVGRVISLRRRQGLGSIVLAEGLRIAREKFGAKAVRISAQEYARPFYEQGGFVKVSDSYLEDGIPHIQMLATFKE